MNAAIAPSEVLAAVDRLRAIRAMRQTAESYVTALRALEREAVATVVGDLSHVRQPADWGRDGGWR